MTRQGKGCKKDLVAGGPTITITFLTCCAGEGRQGQWVSGNVVRQGQIIGFVNAYLIQRADRAFRHDLSRGISLSLSPVLSLSMA